MDAITLIFSAALIGGVLVLIFYPLWQQTRPEAIVYVDHSGQTLEEYQARYQALLAAIKDLMFDYEMGKVSAEDYETSLNRTKFEAASLRRQIDRLSHSATADIEAGLDAELEALIAQTAANVHLNGNEALLREVEAEIELLKNVQPGVDSSIERRLACPNCGKTFQPGDAFCAHCGQSLAGLELESGPDTCPQCGYAFQPDDLFCAKCGAALKQKPNHKQAVTQKHPA